MDLFTPVVPEDKWHPNFKTIVKTQNGFNCDVLNKWAKGFIDRDRKFVKEWQISFNSCFWELYINAVLRELAFNICWKNPSPDFHIDKPVDFTLEATIASNEVDGLEEYRTFEEPTPSDLNEFNRKAIIRLSNSIHSKYERYKAHYSGLPHVSGKPFVIAVAAFDRPHFMVSCQRAIEALLFDYYVDEEEYLSRSDKSNGLTGNKIDRVLKDNGSPVDVGIFVRGLMPEVSAIIFSSTATMGKVRALSSDPNPNIEFTALRLNPSSDKPHIIREKKHSYNETLLDGLRVYHNPNALHPIDPSYFRRKEIFQSYMDLHTGEWEHDQDEGQLLFRNVHTTL